MNNRRLFSILALALSALLIVAVVLTGRLSKGDTPPLENPTGNTALPVIREDKVVGICFPSQSQSWINTGGLLKDRLEADGYRVLLSYGDGTAGGQRALIASLLEQSVHCIITTPVDSAALPAAAELAQEKGVPILAYGSLLMDTAAVSGYISYDYFEMGVAIARRLESELSLLEAEAENRSYTVELFMGDPKDSNALLLYNGLLSVLEFYLQGGVLNCQSGRISFEDNCVPGWSEESAARACVTRLRNYYKKTPPDILLCASDDIAGGIITALENAGISQNQWPLVTGNGASEIGLSNLESGKQWLTVRNNAADPADACTAMVDRALFGVQPDFPLHEVFNNVISVPTALCGFSLMEKS